MIKSVDSFGARQSQPGNGQHRATTSVISYRNLGHIKLANSVKPANTNVTLYLKSNIPKTKFAATYGKQYRNIHTLLCPMTPWAQKISLNYSKTLNRVALLNISIMTTKMCFRFSESIWQKRSFLVRESMFETSNNKWQFHWKRNKRCHRLT